MSETTSTSELRRRAAKAEAMIRAMRADGTIDDRNLACRLAGLDQWLAGKLEDAEPVQLVG